MRFHELIFGFALIFRKQTNQHHMISSYHILVLIQLWAMQCV